MEINKIHLGDCLELMKDIPSGSVDLILTDPPYGNMKGAKLDGWDNETTKWDDSLDIDIVFRECNRILRKNGILILFSQEPYSSNLIVSADPNLPFNYRMIWKKDHFANALIAKKAPVSYFEDILVFSKNFETENIHPLRPYAKIIFDFIGKNKKYIFNIMGNQSVCHFMRTNTDQFTICTEKTYNHLIDLFKINTIPEFMTYDQMLEIDHKYKDKYAKVFNLPDGKKYKSNVLEFKKPYEGLHPTQKPVPLFEDLIYTFSNERNLVLDFTSGSGTTAIACLNTNRNFICIEKDQTYYASSVGRVKEYKKNRILKDYKRN